MPRLGIATNSTKHHFSTFSWHFSYLHPTKGLHAIVRYSALVVALGVALANAQVPHQRKAEAKCGVRCSGTAKYYILYVRLPGSTAPTRLALGDAAKMSLAVARKKAREWLDLIEQGKDPREVERQAKAEAQRRQRTTFAALAEDFIAHKLPSERGGRKIERAMRRDLLPIWSAKPITEITEADVLVLVRAKKSKTPALRRTTCSRLSSGCSAER